ncbi:response regulator [Pseudoduganella umbonata]|uniref:DNA-binding response OmpR family regulator n=1 Tax=Pseudoduganella umbonata TaxID=864828 RepID=A0A4V1ECY2_9BURK|nr:response regulator [Pseudoduganella umbonata]MBB3224888.1 DNA-binding response OmpR family regulator [Pseudoduganella umbonata]QCP09171.1 response regulator [Pseudoduganella umbonata]
MQILVVEDDAVLAMVCAAALEEAGHTVVGPVHDVESFRAISGLDGTNLALLDINLAGGNEGLELARQLRQRGIPALFVSGQLGAARDSASLALGLLRKPYDVDDLLDSIDYLQNSRNPASVSTLQKPAALEIFGSKEHQ